MSDLHVVSSTGKRQQNAGLRLTRRHLRTQGSGCGRSPRRHRAVLLIILALLVTLLASGAAQAAAVEVDQRASVKADLDWGRMPLYFTPNQGQLAGPVAYCVQGHDKTLYFTPQGVTFALSDAASASALGSLSAPGIVSGTPPQQAAGESSRWIVKLDFLDANSVTPNGQDPTDTLISYFSGSPEEWQTALPTYSSLLYPDLWEGIDLLYSGTTDRLKHEFMVQPGADPAQIHLAYRGAAVRLNEQGQLEVSTPVGGFTDDAPIAYQEVNGERKAVSVAFALDAAPAPAAPAAAPAAAAPGAAPTAGDSRSYSFTVGAYDPSLPLVIDPTVLVYCGYIGGSGQEEGFDIAVDSSGCAYVAGYTASTEASFPVTVGPDLVYNGGDDVFVAKVTADGTGLAYVGFIGGSGDDGCYDIAVDSSGCAYVSGETTSTEASFPVVVGPDLTHNGSWDAFVAKVTADGTSLAYAGYIGGTSNELADGLAVDSSGCAYVAGETASTEASFPVAGGPDLISNGVYDAFVAKVTADGSGLVYAGYIGGNGSDYGYGLALDSSGCAYVTGETASTEGTFPVAGGPDLTHNGQDDAFVAKVAADGTGLAYAGYIGGSGDDYGLDLTVDSSGCAYVTGDTTSTEGTFPVAGGPDLTYNGGSRDAFLAKVTANGAGFTYAGYIGGDGIEFGYDVAVDSAGCAYVTGLTTSTEATFPVAGGPDLTYNGGGDAFVAKVAADGAGLVHAGYMGGDGFEYGGGIALDAEGNSYITGYTSSTEANFPVTGGPDLTYNGGGDAFVAKVSAGIAPTVTYTSIIGTDRFDTAIRISQAMFPGVLPDGSGVVLAPGWESYQEALCGAPLAAAWGGPVLLNAITVLYGNVRTELQRLAPDQVFLIGLSPAVATAVQTALPGTPVTSINGTGTAANIVYDMSRKVANALEQKVGDMSGATAIVTIGSNFPDAIGVSPLACANLWPVVLTDKAGGVPAPALHVSATATFTDLGMTKAIKVGTYAVLPGTVAGLAQLSGADRYFTNANVATWGKTYAGLSFAHTGLTTGDKFPDALASGPYLALDDGILLLSPLTGPLPAPISAVITANSAAVQHFSFIACIEPVIGQVKALLP